MGKTYVALAVAVSVLEATRRKRRWWSWSRPPWPRSGRPNGRCSPSVPPAGPRPPRLGAGPARQRLPEAARRPGERRRSHLIFLTHGALTSNLNDPFIRLALLRRAMLRRPDLREAGAKPSPASPSSLLNDRRFDEPTQSTRCSRRPSASGGTCGSGGVRRTRSTTIRSRSRCERALEAVDLAPPARGARRTFRSTATPASRRASASARRQLNQALNATWTESLGALDVHLPLLILDEAHHVKNPNRLARLFDNEEAEQDAEALQGPLGNMFEKMLFLTATPFQLGHHELLHVLDRFHGVRWPSVHASERASIEQTDRAPRAPSTVPRQPHCGSSGRGPASTLSTARSVAGAGVLRTARATNPRRCAPRSRSRGEARTRHRRGRGAPSPVGDPPRQAAQGAATALPAWPVDPRRQRRATSACPSAGRSTLPFLLAARAQAVASLHGADGERSTRAYFAYGLASSFEAYADTRRNRVASLDDARRRSRSPPRSIAAAALVPRPDRRRSPRRHRRRLGRSSEGRGHRRSGARAVVQRREGARVLLLRRDRSGAAVPHLSSAARTR